MPRILFLLGFVMTLLPIEYEFAHAQLAKIHRKTVQLNISPELILQGRDFAVSVQRFEEEVPLRLRLLDRSGKTLAIHPLDDPGPFYALTLSAPEGIQGELRVLAEAERDGAFTPVAEQSVQLLSGWWEEMQALITRLHALEESGEAPRRSVWGLLAQTEDLMERVKTGGPGQAWDVQRRLQALDARVRTLENGADPYNGQTGYQLRGYRPATDPHEHLVAPGNPTAQVTEASESGEIQLYSLYVPRDYDESQEWPLVVMLHGAWSNHHLALRRVFGLTNRRGESDEAAKRTMPSLPDVPYLVVAPNGYETASYEGYAEADVWRIIDEVKALYNVDANRVYLTGLSMGGGGTLRLGMRRPDLFAAIAPVCGFTGYDSREDDRLPEFLRNLRWKASTLAVAENALHLPVYFMHGEVDPVVRVEQSIMMHERLEELGYESHIDVYPGVDHASWEQAYEDARIFDWFAQYQRDPHPREIAYRTADPRGGGAYWAYINRPLRIRDIAEIRAEAVDDAVVIETENVETLSLRVPAVLYPNNEEIAVVIDGQAVGRVRLDADWMDGRFILTNGNWSLDENVDAEPALLPPHRGVMELFVLDHAYAYATAGSEHENAETYAMATIRSLPGGNRDVQWPLLPEDALANPTRNLVFIGTASGSSFLREHTDALPFRLEGDRLHFAGRELAPDEALLTLWPNPLDSNTYVLIGTAASLEGLRGLRNFVTSSLSVRFTGQGDFTVFGPDGDPRWSGLYDKHWQVETIEDF